MLSSRLSSGLVAFSSVARQSLKARGVTRELTRAITTVRTRAFVPSPPITNLAASRSYWFIQFPKHSRTFPQSHSPWSACVWPVRGMNTHAQTSQTNSHSFQEHVSHFALHSAFPDTCRHFSVPCCRCAFLSVCFICMFIMTGIFEYLLVVIVLHMLRKACL